MQLHIAAGGESASCLDFLAVDGEGDPLEYVQVLRMQIGASLDLSTAAQAAAAAPLPAEPTGPARLPMPPAAAAAVTAATTQFTAPMAAPAAPAPPAFPVPASRYAQRRTPSAAPAAQSAQQPTAELRRGSNWRPRGWGAIDEEAEEDDSSADDWRSVGTMSRGISAFASSRSTSRPSASASASTLQSVGGWNAGG